MEFVRNHLLTEGGCTGSVDRTGSTRHESRPVWNLLQKLYRRYLNRNGRDCLFRSVRMGYKGTTSWIKFLNHSLRRTGSNRVWIVGCWYVFVSPRGTPEEVVEVPVYVKTVHFCVGRRPFQTNDGWEIHDLCPGFDVSRTWITFRR